MSRDFNAFFFDQLRFTGIEPSYDDWVSHCSKALESSEEDDPGHLIDPEKPPKQP